MAKNVEVRSATKRYTRKTAIEQVDERMEMGTLRDTMLGVNVLAGVQWWRWCCCYDKSQDESPPDLIPG